MRAKMCSTETAGRERGRGRGMGIVKGGDMMVKQRHKTMQSMHPPAS